MVSPQRKIARRPARRDKSEQAHPVKALQKKIEKEFSGGPPPLFEGTEVELGAFLKRAGINRQEARDRLTHSLVPLLRLAKGGADVDLLLRALDQAVAGAMALPLPERAPRLYRDRDPSQNVVDFLKATWGPWIERRQLTRVLLRDYDPAASRALAHWLYLKRPLPVDMAIPNKSQVIDHIVEAANVSSDVLTRAARSLARRLEKSK